MAIHNTSYDAANTAVRAFLTKVGSMYFGKTFNTGAGKGKEIWKRIREEVFQNVCCYCGKKNEKLQIEHLVMFNREEYGLHHPGNIAPVCGGCNKRKKMENGQHYSWSDHLMLVCKSNNEENEFQNRFQRIKTHINDGEFACPKLTQNERHAIRVIAESLYHNISAETENALVLYGKITDAFVPTKTD